VIDVHDAVFLPPGGRPAPSDRRLPVPAGPVEATALGNVLIQARTAGTISGELSALRALLRRAQHFIRYEPAPVRG
jgi:hypothetical protein